MNATAAIESLLALRSTRTQASLRINSHMGPFVRRANVGGLGLTFKEPGDFVSGAHWTARATLLTPLRLDHCLKQSIMPLQTSHLPQLG